MVKWTRAIQLRNFYLALVNETAKKLRKHFVALYIGKNMNNEIWTAFKLQLKLKNYT